MLTLLSVFPDMVFFFHAGGVKHPLLRFPLREGEHDKNEIRLAAVLFPLRPRGIADQRVFRNLFRRIVQDDVIEPEAARHHIKKNPRDQDRLQGDQDKGEFFSEKRFHTKNASLLVTKLLWYHRHRLRGRTALFLPSAGTAIRAARRPDALLSILVSLFSRRVKIPSPVPAAAACLPRSR